MRKVTILPLVLAYFFSLNQVWGEANADDEMHAVGIYEGHGDEGQGQPGAARVHVDRPGKNVSLVLTAYDSTTWTVTHTEKTTIRNVILGGYEQQTVKGIPESATTTDLCRDRSAPSKLWLRYPHSSIGQDFRQHVRQVHTVTGEELSSFQGLYRASPEPIQIDAIQNDPRLSSAYPQPVALETLPADVRKASFQAIHYVRTNRMQESQSYGTFTLTGPVESSLKPLPSRVTRIAYDPDGKCYYGINGGSDVVRVDLENGKVEEISKTGLSPSLSWASEITYDSKRKRVILGSSGGGGHFYAYDTQAKEWSLIAKRPGSIDAFVYSPTDDCLYGILLGHSEEGYIGSLAKVNANGALVSVSPLGSPIGPGNLPGGPGVTTTQVALVGDYLAILASPKDSSRDREQGLEASYIYLVNPKEPGKVWLTSKVIQHKAPTEGARFRHGETFIQRDGRLEKRRRIILPPGRR